MKLSVPQRNALTKLRDGDNSAHGLKVGLATMAALHIRDMVRPVGRAHMAIPHSAAWRITLAGKAAIFRLAEKETA